MYMYILQDHMIVILATHYMYLHLYEVHLI